ncbi:MAG: B12-binding domain-containing radical SAM protein [Nitrospira sp.]|nr:B12-binding domain-containing radical SAM protein [Nitrospira sp.]MDH4244768.1 B12-binding domain-containing radical SAM protein [Nitrospira sp.]MDH4355125.1 B12-binding domain-containing radical SAM protein [Nitrospira sp.]MDH5320010.1 B12-binding domain-containing radical SAM protein [Nitrospira sp.]
MKLDLVIVNPGHRTLAYQGLGEDLAAIEPPVWAGLIATYVRKKGYSVALIDANAEDLSPEDVAVRIQSMKPLLVAIVVYGHNPSASTQVMPGASATCSAIKNVDPSTTILLLGGHVAALPERTLREEEADYVCGGEGPVTVVELIETLRDSAQPDLRQVRDLWYWDGDSVSQSAPAPLVESLDRDLSSIAWDLLPMRRYRAHNWHCFENIDLRQPYAAIYTTLGCPFHCSFCCIQAPFKRGEQMLRMRESLNSYRYWSPKSVLAQIDLLVTRYGVRNIKIADEMFVLNRKHVLAICQGLIDRRYDLNIWAYARVDTVREGMADIMLQAGIKWLAFGIEAASERVRDAVDKGYDQQDIFATVERVRKAGTSVVSNYIFGLPEDDLVSMKATLALAQELNTEYANFYCTMAYPGSALYAQALQQGWPLPDHWSGYSQHAADSFPLPTRHLTSVDVLRFRDAAFRTYFSNLRYQLMMRERFGDGTVAHIDRMTQQRLSRVVTRPEQASMRLPSASPEHSVIPLTVTRGAT